MVRGLIFQWLITESNPSLVAPMIERPLVIERGAPHRKYQIEHFGNDVRDLKQGVEHALAG